MIATWYVNARLCEIISDYATLARVFASENDATYHTQSRVNSVCV
jgi:hypothetical protein